MFSAPLPVIDQFVEDLEASLRSHSGGRGLSCLQRAWLKFCLMGVLMTNTVCWKAFERSGLRGYGYSALSWMFRHSKIDWEGLWQASVAVVLAAHGITDGVLVVDDSDVQRAKQTKRIHRAYRLHDKKTGGSFNGQSLVFVVLVTSKVTLPVGWAFYAPDPAQSAWRREEARLKAQGVTRAQRPKRPAPNPAYPSQSELALKLIATVRRVHAQVRIKAVVADALYGTRVFLDRASALCEGAQTISQLRHNQKVRFRGRERSLSEYFRASPGVPQHLRVRGGEEIAVSVSSARLHVCAHDTKRFVIALTYPGQSEPRYLVASDLSWRTLDILQVATLRWLVEVFLADWKRYEGWGALAKQPDEEGSSRSLILSLLLDHALLLHPEQTARLKQPAPACTVGSLREACRAEALIAMVRELLSAEDPAAAVAQWAEQVKALYAMAPSSKHMNGRDLGRQEPTPSLRYRALEAMASA